MKKLLGLVLVVGLGSSGMASELVDKIGKENVVIVEQSAPILTDVINFEITDFTALVVNDVTIDEPEVCFSISESTNLELNNGLKYPIASGYLDELDCRSIYSKINYPISVNKYRYHDSRSNYSFWNSNYLS